MPEFMFAYHGGKMPETPEEGAKAMAAWEAWYKDLGESVVHPGNPVGMSKTVSAGGIADDGGSNPLSVVAESLNTAEVAPIVEM